MRQTCTVEIQAPCVVVAAVVSAADFDGKALAAESASINHRQTPQFNSPNQPEIARNNVGDPGEVAGKRLTGCAVLPQRHYQQIRFY